MRPSPPAAAYAALIAICIAWGTVYLGIRIALESFPPTLLMGIRFFSAGVIILAIGAAVRAKMPSRREFFFTSVYGVITLGLGLGTLFFAIQWIPSGLAAMLTTTSPFWMVGIEALLRGGEKPNLPTVAGMVIGLAGTLLLVTPGALEQGLGGAVFFSFVILQIGCAGFALGSILERRHQSTTHPIINAAVQELATGVVFLIPALLLPQPPVNWNTRGLLAIAYLFLVGGVIGYSAYIYAIKHLPVSLVSIYTYVNPVVAVLLGALLYGEKVGIVEIVSMLLVFTGVLVVKRYSGRSSSHAADTQPSATSVTAA